MDESVRVVVDTAPVRVVVTGAQGPSGEISGTVNHISFDTTPTSVPTTLGTLSWNTDDECLEYAVTGGTISIGKEMYDYYTNLSGVAMVDGDIVSVVGATGSRTAVDLTDATDATSSANVIGMVTHGAANNGIVRVTKTGSVHTLNTDGLAEGGTIYVDPANPGKWTMTRPTSPNHVVSIGVVQVAHSVNGVVDVVPNHQCVTSADVIDATSDAWPASNRVLKASAGSLRLSELICNGPIRSSQVLIQSFDNDTGEADGFYAAITLPSGMTQNSGLIAPKADGTIAVTDQSDGRINMATGVVGALPVANGGTGATTQSSARTNLGLGTTDTPVFTEVRGVTTMVVRAFAGSNSRVSVGQMSITNTLNSGFQTTFDNDGLWPPVSTQLGKSTARWSTVWTASANVSTTLTVGSATWNGSTISGAQSFSGQVELTGQAATNATSAMTRSLSDSRYGLITVTRIASDYDITAASFADIPATVTALDAGSDYEIGGFIAVETTGGSPANHVQFRFGYSGTLQTVQGLNVNVTNSGTTSPMVNGTLLTTTFADTTDVDRTYPIIGYIRTNAAGNFSVQAYRITGGTVNPKLLAGSILTFRKL